MANRKRHITLCKLIAFLYLLTCCVSFAQAQASRHTDFYVERRFVQRLSWNGSQYASRYEVIIEREEAGSFRRAHHGFTTTVSIEVSLPPGKYRYCVIPYDLFNNPGARSAWVEFEIFTAVLPKLYFSVPELYLADTNSPEFNKEYVLMIYGTDISYHADIFLRMENGRVILPAHTLISQDGNSARLVFSDYKAIPDIFNVVVRNPGELEASLRTRSYIFSPPDRSYARQIFIELDLMPESLVSFFDYEIIPEKIAVVDEHKKEAVIKEIEIITIIEEETQRETDNDEADKPPSLPSYKSVDWYLSVSYAPLFSVFGHIFLLPEAVTTLSAAAFNLGFINTAENSFLGFGLEASLFFASFYIISPDYQEQYFPVNAMTIDANLVVQKKTFNEMMAFKFRFGAGINILSGDYEIQNILNSDLFHVNIGASFLLSASKFFFLETGINMVYWILNEETSGSIRPFIGIGLKF